MGQGKGCFLLDSSVTSNDKVMYFYVRFSVSNRYIGIGLLQLHECLTPIRVRKTFVG